MISDIADQRPPRDERRHRGGARGRIRERNHGGPDEIRNLAEISASRSKEISVDISTIKSTIDSVVSSSDDAERSFTTVLDLIESLNSLEREIKQAMTEQSERSKQFLEALNIITVTQRVHDGPSR